MKYDINDPKVIWVSPDVEDAGTGLFESPFPSMRQALDRARPGSVIVLKAGEYTEDVTFQVSGTIDDPIHIIGQEGADGTVVSRGSWFFYDISDLIVSGITFMNTPGLAVSVMGASERNNFSNLHFIDCATGLNAPCTFFFGGSGARCNVVENCIFEINGEAVRQGPKDLPIGIMITQGDADVDAPPNLNHIFRGNRFSGYGCALVLGTKDENGYHYNHIVEHNIILSCTSDGIRIKCGETFVRNNIIQSCVGNGVAIRQGTDQYVCDNRIQECGTGIFIGENDCTLSNNCIVKSGGHAIHVATNRHSPDSDTGDIIIENNSCIESGDSKNASNIDILLDTQAFCVIQNNLFYGTGSPYKILKNKKTAGRHPMDERHLCIKDNCISAQYDDSIGCNKSTIPFTNHHTRDFTTVFSYGAKGWMTRGDESDLFENKRQSREGNDADEPMKNPGLLNPEVQPVENETDNREKDKYLHALFLSALAPDGYEEPAEEIKNEGDGIIDFSTWDE